MLGDVSYSETRKEIIKDVIYGYYHFINFGTFENRQAFTAKITMIS